MWRSSSSKSAAVYKISSKSDDFSLRYGYITIFKIAAVRHLKFWKFSFLITWRSPSSKSAAVYKILSNRIIFRWDIAIYRFAKWRSSAILELFYHYTRPPTKSLLLAAAACQISCQFDTQIWRYSYLNFSHILAWNASSGLQNGFLGEFWTLTCDYSSSRPPKAHPCVNPGLLPSDQLAKRVVKFGSKVNV